MFSNPAMHLICLMHTAQNNSISGQMHMLAIAALACLPHANVLVHCKSTGIDLAMQRLETLIQPVQSTHRVYQVFDHVMVHLLDIMQQRIEEHESSYPKWQSSMITSQVETLVWAVLASLTLMLHHWTRIYAATSINHWEVKTCMQTVMVLSWLDQHMSRMQIVSMYVMQIRKVVAYWPSDCKVIDRCYADCLHELTHTCPCLDAVIGAHRMLYHMPVTVLPDFVQALSLLPLRDTLTGHNLASVVSSLGVLWYTSDLDPSQIIPHPPWTQDLIHLLLVCFPNHVEWIRLLLLQSQGQSQDIIASISNAHLDPVSLLGLSEHDMLILVFDPQNNHCVYRVHRLVLHQTIDDLTPTCVELHVDQIDDVRMAMALMYDETLVLTPMQLLDVMDIALQLDASRLLAEVGSKLMAQPRGWITLENVETVWLRVRRLQSKCPVLANAMMRMCYHYVLVHEQSDSVAESNVLIQALYALDDMSRGCWVMPQIESNQTLMDLRRQLL
jgi:hypothetical protein